MSLKETKMLVLSTRVKVILRSLVDFTTMKSYFVLKIDLFSINLERSTSCYQLYIIKMYKICNKTKHKLIKIIIKLKKVHRCQYGCANVI